MRIEQVPAREADEAVWAAAEALAARLPYMSDPMLLPAFARIVARHRADTYLLLAWQGGELAGFWPVHLASGEWARPVGGPFSDWHAPLIAPDAPLHAVDLLEGAGLCGMTVFGYRPAPGEPCLAGERVGVNLAVLNRPLEDWFETQRAAFPKHFKKMRRMRSKLSRDFSEVRFDADDRSDATFETIIALKREQYVRTGRHDVLASGWAQGLLADLRALGRPGLRAQVSSLHADGRFVAGELNLRSDTVIHGWLTAYDPDFAAYSPGYLVVEDIIRAMLQSGARVYDAGSGRDDYKKYFCNVMSPMDRGVLRIDGQGVSVSRLAGNGWRAAETALPRPAANLMARLRRRTDQIVMAEPDLAGRVKGFLDAFTRTEV